MSLSSHITSTPDEQVSFVVRHHVQAGCNEAFETWLRAEVLPGAHGFAGPHNTTIFHSEQCPDEYLIVVHFQDDAALQRFLGSPLRAKWRQEATAFSKAAPEEGMEFQPDVWLTLGSQPVLRPPRRERLFLLMWSAVFPVILLLGELLPKIFPPSVPRWIITLVISGSVVASMVFVAAPFLTTHFANWLAPVKKDSLQPTRRDRHESEANCD